MGKHRRTPHVFSPARAISGKGVTTAPQTDSLGRATRGIAVLALVLGSLGAEAAAVSGFGADHVGARQPLGGSRIGADSQLTSSGRISQRPWMY